MIARKQTSLVKGRQKSDSERVPANGSLRSRLRLPKLDFDALDGAVQMMGHLLQVEIVSDWGETRGLNYSSPKRIDPF